MMVMLYMGGLYEICISPTFPILSITQLLAQTFQMVHSQIEAFLPHYMFIY